MQQSILEIKRRLARLLVEKSYREGDFVLASGRRSDYYFDCRVTALHAEGSWLIGTLFNDLLKDVPVVGVGGMTMGADPLVSATTAISHELGRPLNGLLERSRQVPGAWRAFPACFPLRIRPGPGIHRLIKGSLRAALFCMLLWGPAGEKEEGNKSPWQAAPAVFCQEQGAHRPENAPERPWEKIF